MSRRPPSFPRKLWFAEPRSVRRRLAVSLSGHEMIQAGVDAAALSSRGWRYAANHYAMVLRLPPGTAQWQGRFMEMATEHVQRAMNSAWALLVADPFCPRSDP